MGVELGAEVAAGICGRHAAEGQRSVCDWRADDELDPVRVKWRADGYGRVDVDAGPGDIHVIDEGVVGNAGRRVGYRTGVGAIIDGESRAGGCIG